jgi:hypothetical protein
MARIKWTAEERALTINTLASYLKSNNKTSDVVYQSGWFAFYIQQAQQFLPPDRKRQINAPSTIPWFESALRAAMGEPPINHATLQKIDVEAFVRSNLASVVAELSKTHVVVEKTECVARLTSRGHTTKQRQIRVLVIGVLPAQAAALSDRFGGDLDLRFWYSSDGDHSQDTLPAVDYAIAVKFISHSMNERLRRAFKARYTSSMGAFSAVERTLKGIVANGKALSV